jgi:hypothetical protein
MRVLCILCTAGTAVVQWAKKDLRPATTSRHREIGAEISLHNDSGPGAKTAQTPTHSSGTPIPGSRQSPLSFDLMAFAWGGVPFGIAAAKEDE